MISNKKNYISWNHSSFFIIALIAILFGHWFAQEQLLAISPTAAASYPKHLFILTQLRCASTIMVFFALSLMMIMHLSQHKLNPIYIALSYAPLLMVYAYCPLAWIFCMIMTLQLASLIYTWRCDDYKWLASRYLIDFLVLLALFSLHLMLTTLVSPIHWNSALLSSLGFVSEEIPIQAPIYKSFSLAKQFVFSPFDYSEWGAILNPPITLNSPFLQLLTLVFDLPSISPTAFHIVLAAVEFILIVGGSFGFYLFLKYALKLHPLFAFFGGCLMFFSNATMLTQMMASDGGVFLTCYAIFPFSLLMISLAFEKQSYIYACWAGAALASQLFFFTPHPEGILYSFLFFAIYTIGMCLFSKKTENFVFSFLFFGTYTSGICVASRKLAWSKSILLGLTACVAFGLLVLYPLLPILIDQVQGNAHTFAHTGDVKVNTFDDVMPYFKILVLLGPISLILLPFQKRLSAVYLSSLLLCLSLATLYSLTTSQWIVTDMVQSLHIGLHVWISWRIGMFLSLAIFIVSLSSLDAIARMIVAVFCKLFPRLLTARTL